MLLYCICLSLIFGFVIHNGVGASTLGLDPEPPARDCEDHLLECQRDKEHGLCHLLLHYCQDTCGLCVCKDVAPDPSTCTRAKLYGYCTKYKDSYEFWCRKTCGLCGDLPLEKPATS